MAPEAHTHVVSGPEALAEFRQGLTGQDAAEWLDRAGGRLLIALPVGVGKTRLLIDTAVHMRTIDDRYDLVVVLVPRRDILDEIRLKLPADLPHVVLEPRPRARCGDLDAPWVVLERGGCGLLAREEICRTCPRREGCPWPDQCTAGRLRGAGLVLATQQRLANERGLVDRLGRLADARKTLVLLDESDLLVGPARRSVAAADLQRFVAAQEMAIAGVEQPTSAPLRQLEYCRNVAEAAPGDLRLGRWPYPEAGGDWDLQVQRAGRGTFGDGFKFPGYDLASFGRSDPSSRERTAAGDLQFARPPDLGDDFVIFSGSVAPGLARYRLDPDHRRGPLISPFDGHRFDHPGTTWFNINSAAGAARYFPGNASAILDFFAEKIARNIRDGRRTLLVARKKFRGWCADHLSMRLLQLNAGIVRVVTGDWDSSDLADPRTLPLINYGVSGVNRFEDFDCAYCLTGYYVDEKAIAAAVQDLDATPDRFPIRVVTRGKPARRTARVELPDDRETILPRLAAWTLEQKEADVVVQAVGRVRPFTRPREVITFQTGALPGVDYTVEFDSVGGARRYFGIPSRRLSEAGARAAEARRLNMLDLTVAQIAARLGVSDSSVKRYLRPAKGHETF